MVRKVYDYLFNQNHPLAWSAVVIISFGLVMTINFYWINAQDEQTTFIIASTGILLYSCLLYTSPSPRDRTRSRMPSSA